MQLIKTCSPQAQVPAQRFQIVSYSMGEVYNLPEWLNPNNNTSRDRL